MKTLWDQAWDYYFTTHSNVAANWGHQNGRWPHSCDIPEWYEAHPEAQHDAPGEGNPAQWSGFDMEVGLPVCNDCMDIAINEMHS